jgi:hypothetical protein
MYVLMAGFIVQISALVMILPSIFRPQFQLHPSCSSHIEQQSSADRKCDRASIAGGVAGAAAVVGLPMPYLLRILKRNPQVAAGPIALAASDMLTLLLEFSFARWLLA